MNTPTVVKRGIYTVSDLYNGTLRAVVIFVGAKIHFLLHISKYCQNFFSHRVEAFQLLEKQPQRLNNPWGKCFFLDLLYCIIFIK